MKIKYVFGIILIFLLINNMIGCFEPKATEFFNKELEATDNTILSVNTINGQIEISVWENDTISFNAIKKSSISKGELEKINININENENMIEINTVYNGDRLTTPTVDMNIKVPESVTVKSAKTSNGGIQISGTKGDVVATTSNGAIVIDNVNGYVSAITSNGRIEVTQTTGIKELKSSNMGIEVEIYDFKDNLKITTSNGGITAYINPLLNADINMSTSNGKISIEGVSLNLSVSENKHKSGILGDGGDTIDIITSNGNIFLKKLDI